MPGTDWRFWPFTEAEYFARTVGSPRAMTYPLGSVRNPGVAAAELQADVTAARAAIRDALAAAEAAAEKDWPREKFGCTCRLCRPKPMPEPQYIAPAARPKATLTVGGVDIPVGDVKLTLTRGWSVDPILSGDLPTAASEPQYIAPVVRGFTLTWDECAAWIKRLTAKDGSTPAPTRKPFRPGIFEMSLVDRPKEKPPVLTTSYVGRVVLAERVTPTLEHSNYRDGRYFIVDESDRQLYGVSVDGGNTNGFTICGLSDGLARLPRTGEDRYRFINSKAPEQWMLDALNRAEAQLRDVRAGVVKPQWNLATYDRAEAQLPRIRDAVRDALAAEEKRARSERLAKQGGLSPKEAKEAYGVLTSVLAEAMAPGKGRPVFAGSQSADVAFVELTGAMNSGVSSDARDRIRTMGLIKEAREQMTAEKTEVKTGGVVPPTSPAAKKTAAAAAPPEAVVVSAPAGVPVVITAPKSQLVVFMPYEQPAA